MSKRQRIRELEARVTYLEGMLIIAFDGIGKAHDQIDELAKLARRDIKEISKSVGSIERVFSGYVN